MEHIPVLIVGAGPTGLTMAIELTRRDIPYRIVDKVPQRPYTESRADGLHAHTMEVFERIGLLPTLLAEGRKIQGFHFYADGKSIGRMSAEKLNSPYPFILEVPQSVIERVLIEYLEQHGVRIERPVEVTAVQQDASTVTVMLQDGDGQERQVQASYLVAADGGHSVVRKQLGLDFPGHRIQGAYVMDAQASFKMPLSEDEGTFVMSRRSVAVIGRRPDGLWRVAVMLPQDDTRLSHESPTLQQMQNLLTEDYPSFGVQLSHSLWSSAFFLSSRMSQHLRQGRIFLAGDAAHVHSPVGGQGMNTGMQDAVNLAWKLALCLSGAGGERLLNSYEAERYPVMSKLLSTTETSTKVLMWQHPLLVTLRTTLLSIASLFPTMQAFLISSFTGFSVQYRRSPVIQQQKQRRLFDHPCPGDYAPDARGLRNQEGTRKRWYEWWGRDPRHQLLVFSGRDSSPQRLETLRLLIRQIETRYGTLVHPHLVLFSAQEKGEHLLIDEKGELHRRYKARAGGLYLLRPDGFIAYQDKQMNLLSLERWMRQTFTTFA